MTNSESIPLGYYVFVAIYCLIWGLIYIYNKRLLTLNKKFDILSKEFALTIPLLKREEELYRLTYKQGYRLEEFRIPIKKIVERRKFLLDEMDKIVFKLKPINFLRFK